MELRPILSTLLRNKTAALLIALQVAISLAILVNALFIVNVRLEVAARPSGIDDESAVFSIFTRTVRRLDHAEQMAMQKQQYETLRAVPGVVSVALTNQMPMSRSGSTTGVSLNRQQQRSSVVVASYFSPDPLVKTLGLKLLEGRDFQSGDIEEIDPATSNSSGTTVIITKGLADALYPGTSAIGKPLLFGTGNDASELRIIGVVERLQTYFAQMGAEADYSAIRGTREPLGGSMFAVRAEPGQSERVIRDAEAALQKNAITPLVVRSRTVTTDRESRYRNDRALAWMLVTVSVLLLLVTASGIVGMTSLWVSQRRKHIGVRRALGGRRVDIMRYFITENLVISSCGVTLGLVLALALNQLLVSQLELARLPAGYLLAGVGIFWALGLAAVYGPSWRAANIAPAIATRSA